MNFFSFNRIKNGMNVVFAFGMQTGSLYGIPKNQTHHISLFVGPLKGIDIA